ncbi:MAG: sugar phosphate nucleotidyltransferase [Actinomycetota bacterium]
MTEKFPITKAILLVGGKGTRLAPLTNQIPKPMLKVAGKPVTEHQIVKAREAGIKEIVLATSYMAEVFEPYFGDGSNFGISIKYAVEEIPLGTGGAIANAAQLLSIEESESIVIFNGDVLSAHNLSQQITQHGATGADVTLYLTEVEDARAYGCVPMDSEGRVSEFLEKMDNPKAKTINAGCYVFTSRAIAEIPRNSVVSVERDTFPRLLQNDFSVYGYKDGRYWIDMGTPQSFLKASRDLILDPSLSSATGAIFAQSLIEDGAVIDSTAHVGEGSMVSAGVRIGPRATVMGSMVMNEAVIGEGSTVIDSYIAPGIKIPPGTEITGKILG